MKKLIPILFLFSSIAIADTDLEILGRCIQDSDNEECVNADINKDGVIDIFDALEFTNCTKLDLNDDQVIDFSK